MIACILRLSHRRTWRFHNGRLHTAVHAVTCRDRHCRQTAGGENGLFLVQGYFVKLWGTVGLSLCHSWSLQTELRNTMLRGLYCSRCPYLQRVNQRPSDEIFRPDQRRVAIVRDRSFSVALFPSGIARFLFAKAVNVTGAAWTVAVIVPRTNGCEDFRNRIFERT